MNEQEKARMLALEKAVLLLCQAIQSHDYAPGRVDAVHQARLLVGVEDGDYNERTRWVAKGEATGNEGVWQRGNAYHPARRVR